MAAAELLVAVAAEVVAMVMVEAVVAVATREWEESPEVMAGAGHQ